MEDAIRIKVQSIEKLQKNMQIEIQTLSGESKTGFFKKFMVKVNGKNVYRSSVENLPTAEEVFIFFTDQEQDQVKGQSAPQTAGGMQPQLFVKSDSVSIKQIKELFIIPPPNSMLFFAKLQRDIKELKAVAKQQQQSIQELVAVIQQLRDKNSKSSKKHSS